MALCGFTLVYVFLGGAGAGIRVGVGVQETVGIEVGVEVPLSLVRAPTSLSLLVREELQQQLC